MWDAGRAAGAADIGGWHSLCLDTGPVCSKKEASGRRVPGSGMAQTSLVRIPSPSLPSAVPGPQEGWVAQVDTASPQLPQAFSLQMAPPSVW